MSIRGKNAVVTGGLGALGLEVVKRFLEEGVRVAIPTIGGAGMGSLPDQIRGAGDAVFIGNADLSNEEEARRFVTTASSRLGIMDILVNAAGGYSGGEAVGQVSVETFDRMLSMNLRTSFLMCSILLPSMRAQRYGRIINIAAMPAITPRALSGPYAISKRGVVTLTETIAEEVKGTGITANAIAPSVILTPANKASMPDADSSKWVTPSELAALMVFLCSDAARSISGNVIKVYGGV